MAKTLTITVTDSENPESPEVFELEYTTEVPTDAEWTDILKFEDDHVGGRPNDR